jgi:Protein of unknown function (DUF3144)
VQNSDDKFFDRVDEHIRLSNKQISKVATYGKVSASMLYATARFNAWVSACNCDTSERMAAAKEKIIEYFVSEYRKMLEENMDDHIKHFQSYMQSTDDLDT